MCISTTSAVTAIILSAWTAVSVRGQGAQSPPSAGGTLTPIEKAIVEVEARRRTTPLISAATSAGHFIVTFLAKSTDGQVPRVVSDVTGWGENVVDDTFDFDIGRMTRVGQTAWYSLETPVVPGARIEYLIVHGRHYTVDPHNPRQASLHPGGPASEFVTPGYEPPKELAGDAPAGRSAERYVRSQALGGSRRVIVYTPPGYRRGGEHPMVVFQNGVRIAQGARTPASPRSANMRPAIEADVPARVLDRLIARRAIEPLVAVFVESRRYGDTRSHPRAAMRTFLADELPAWIASRYCVAKSADKRAIVGVSAGAREAFEAAIASPGAFGRLALLIPGRRVALEPELEPMILRAPHKLRVTILAARYDQANIATAVTLRRALVDAGHTVQWIEVPEGHNRATSRNHVQDVLVALFKPDLEPRSR